MKILLLSDTHGYLDEGILKHADAADEIWHAGDFGTIEVADQLQKLNPCVAFGEILMGKMFVLNTARKSVYD